MGDAENLRLARDWAARMQTTISESTVRDGSYDFEAHGTDRRGRQWSISASGPSEMAALKALCDALWPYHWDYFAYRFDNNSEVLSQALFLAFPGIVLSSVCHVSLMTSADNDGDVEFFLNNPETDVERTLAITKQQIVKLPDHVYPTFTPKNVLAYLQRSGVIERLQSARYAEIR